MLALVANQDNYKIVNLLDILNKIATSPYTANAIALFAAIGAYIIYSRNKVDYKKDAANIILLEIKNAEENYAQAKQVYEEAQSKPTPYVAFPEKVKLMPRESWSKYKYLFGRDLESRQYDDIGKFYDFCQKFDEAIEHKDSSFRRDEEAIRVGIQHNIAAFSKELSEAIKLNPDNNTEIAEENERLENEYIEKSRSASKYIIGKLAYLYTPDKSYNDAVFYFKLIPTNLYTSTTGAVLKKIAK